MEIILSVFHSHLMVFLTGFTFLICVSIYSTRKRQRCTQRKNLVINWHFTRKCNYSCKFCFHTAKADHHVKLKDAKTGIKQLRDKGMVRINFSGGEPFLKPRYLGKLCKFCKCEMNLQVSIVSNGSKIRRDWLEQYGQYLDVLAISCDSFEENTLKVIGRYENKKSHIEQLKKISKWCAEFNIRFKINTVVCSANKNETMVKEIMKLNPCRWKVFQCLLIEGENHGENALRDATNMTVTKKEFDLFISRHEAVKCLVPENNSDMRNSYLILDEQMRFLNNVEGQKRPTVSILDNVQEALNDSGFDHKKFKKRTGEWCTSELQW